MSFLDSLKALFGGKKKEPQVAAKPAPSTRAPMPNNTTLSRQKCSQVYAARPTEVPEWAKDINTSDLLVELKKHAVCKYVPNFEVKKIMSTQIGADGNLIAEYDGVAGDCGAVKNFGGKVAQQIGVTQAFKYFDVNNAYRACCDNPKKCPFYLTAVGENETVNSRRR